MSASNVSRDLLADELDQRVEVELRRERLADAVHRRELGHALTRLVEQASVVERDAQAAGQGGQEPLVVLAERMRAVDVLERDDSGRAAADDERDEERRLDRLPAEHERVAVALRHLGRDLRDHQRLARLHHVLAEADQRDRVLLEALAALDHVREGQKSAGLVVDRDAHDLGVEDLLELVADEVVDRLRIELAGDRRLHAVDQRELRVSPPGLVDELCVVERDS